MSQGHQEVEMVKLGEKMMKVEVLKFNKKMVAISATLTTVLISR